MPNRRSPTILDVAKHARVSVGTVSNVLNGTIRVSDARRARVEQAIADLGYTRNMVAQSLRKRQLPLVGLCIPSTSISYFSALVDACEGVALDRGFEIIQVLSHRDPAMELQRVEALLRYRVAGIMLLPSREPAATLDLIASSGTPVVVVDRPTGDPRFDEVTFNNYETMVEGTARLIALGHRRILFVVQDRGLSITVRRIEALHAAAGMAPDDVSVRVVECGHAEADFLFRLRPELGPKHRPTAMIVSNSTLASQTLRLFRTLGIRCPEDMSLLAFDEPEWADLVSPPLSVIRQPTRAIATTAWDFLMTRMRSEQVDVQHAELRAEIIFRESVAPVRTGAGLEQGETRALADPILSGGGAWPKT